MHKFVASCALAGAVALGAPGVALAHAHLKSAAPAENATVASAPSTLHLHFSEGLNLTFTGIAVTAADGTKVALGKASLADDGKTLNVPVKNPLAAGAYTVKWHALSQDGHKTKGSYTFTVAP
jgi:methionine-rich copper-binding protein CopC